MALDEIGAGLDTELEIIGSELASIEAEFVSSWGSLPEFKDYRFVTREVSSTPAIVFVAAREQNNEITIWNIRIVENPFPIN